MSTEAITLLFGGGYDRVQDLAGIGRENGIAVTPEILPGPKDAFEALAQTGHGDGGEMSVSFYMTRRSKLGRQCDLVALPVWISRSFRHGNVYVREDSPLTTLAELAGARVGLAEYGMTMAVWLRGTLADEAGVAAADISWHTGRKPTALDDELVRYPSDVSIVEADRAVPLLEQVASGRLDALIGAGTVPLPPSIRRLLPDHAADERAYFARTGIFPIMHVLVLRREFVERRPDDVERVYATFVEAKARAQRRLWSSSVSYATLPWLLAAVEEQTALMGGDPWPYGIRKNLPTLTALHRYLTEQDLLWADLDLAEYFLPYEPST